MFLLDVTVIVFCLFGAGVCLGVSLGVLIGRRQTADSAYIGVSHRRRIFDHDYD